MKKVFNVDLDIKKSTSILVGAVQYDNDTSILSITLKDGNKPFDVPDGYDVELVFRRPDRKIFVVNGDIELKEKNKILNFVLDSSMLSIFGIADIEIRISKDDEVLTTGRFALEIRESLLSSGNEVIAMAKVSAIPIEKIKSVFMGVSSGR
ncbi:BppU family phage baseplate upper protein [Peptoniphilus sp. AGMB00490]|uniref:BppU family phage baseplate upper protein n=1 Tax=Peptoniphilus faecalis TaxID=2731255 RepID=A0A848RGW3_9FIRM|nr:BppU family phage baseplate upper protein [Peptoniphilus faecalis]NMW84669.1 BppU family phage baseplate upper protein [Peptoniphilus faecalis]